MEKVKGFIIQQKEGLVYVGSGYGGPGKPIAYWEPTGQSLKNAKVYKTQKGAREQADRIGGIVGVVDLGEDGRPENWLGFAIKLGAWNRYATYKDGIEIMAEDPEDHMNPINGPLQ